MNKMIEKIELLNKQTVVLFKIGNFYHAYGRDAYIMSYLFGYKIKSTDNNKECGFPLSSLNKVMAELEDKKVNYIVVDKRNNYDVDEKFDFKNLNKYQLVYEKARTFVNYKFRIDEISDNLLNMMQENDFRKLLGEIEKLIDERREIQCFTID